MTTRRGQLKLFKSAGAPNPEIFEGVDATFETNPRDAPGRVRVTCPVPGFPDGDQPIGEGPWHATWSDDLEDIDFHESTAEKYPSGALRCFRWDMAPN